MWLHIIVSAPFLASAQGNPVEFNADDIIQKSQISYRAQGGFTSINSYGVILSCVNGKISVLKSITDPNLNTNGGRIHELAEMDQDQYLALWDKLHKVSALNAKNVPNPRLDILEEFTHTFHLQVGDQSHQFQVYGINRPEASRHFAIKTIIDQAANMKSMWNSHQTLAHR